MKKLFLFIAAALVSTSLLADTFYILSAKSNVPLTAGMNNAKTQLLKLDETTLSATTDISSSQTGAASLYYNTTTASYVAFTNTTNYGTSSTSSRTMQAIKLSKNTQMKITLNSVKCSKMDVIYRCASSDPCKITINGVEVNTSDQNIHLYSNEATYKDSIIINGDANKEYQLVVVLTMAPIIPSLTGAWKIDEDTVTNSNIMQESVAPTAPTFSIGATSGAPTSDNYTVAYSLKEGSTEGIFTYSESGISAISTASAGSATIVATLTTKDATKYLTPKTNTFEYTVTVSPAAAPTFTSVTPSATSVVRGTASTIVAVVAGTPTPTIQWYSNTTESNEGGEEIDGATDLTLNLENTAVGTFYYYAIATNTTAQENNVASPVQTITVNPKAPVLPASGSFIESKSITIAKADGEAEAAVIKYSTDGKTWNDYSAAIELTGTTTIQAKVVQSGLESAVASATYTLIILDEQVDVTASTNWDWTAATNSSDVDLKANSGIFRNVDVLLSDISKGGYTAVAGLASQQALLMNGEFAYRNANGTKMCQVNYLKINTTVAGKISIEYANTGGNAARTVGVKVGDGEYQYGTHSSDGNVYDGSDASKQKYVTDEFDIAAGSITIAGAQVSDKAAKMLRIRKVIFTAKYAVNCADAENGTLVADKALAAAGEEVTLTITPAEGYELNVLTVKDAMDADVTVTDGKFTMPASNVTVTATFKQEGGGTSISNTSDAEKAQKRIENGQLVIEKNGKVFNAMGQTIR